MIQNKSNGTKRFYRRLLLIFVFVIFLSLFSLSADELQVGSIAQEMVGQDAVTGNRMSLYRTMTQLQFKRDASGNLVIGENGKYISEFIHNIVILNFFAKTCIPCLREIPNLNRIARSYEGQNVKFLYVNVDPDLDADSMQRLINQYKIEIPVMLPNQKEAIRKYSVLHLPRLVVVGKDKKIALVLTGFQEDLKERLWSTITNLQ